MRKTKAQILNEAERIATFIMETNNLEENSRMLDLREMIVDLNHGEIDPGADNWYRYQQFIVEVACLLSNPDISRKLSTDIQEHSFEMLRGLSSFFSVMAEDNRLHTSLLCHSLMHLRPEVDEQTLAQIKEDYCQGMADNAIL